MDEAFFAAEAERRKKWDAINSGLISVANSSSRLPALPADAPDSNTIHIEDTVESHNVDEHEVGTKKDEEYGSDSQVESNGPGWDSGTTKGLVCEDDQLPEESLVIVKKRKLIIV